MIEVLTHLLLLVLTLAMNLVFGLVSYNFLNWFFKTKIKLKISFTPLLLLNIGLLIGLLHSFYATYIDPSIAIGVTIVHFIFTLTIILTSIELYLIELKKINLKHVWIIESVILISITFYFLHK